MAIKRTPTKSYLATVEKFKRLDLSFDEGVELIRQNIAVDLKNFTEGAMPAKKERVKWLARMGHPYGRKSSAAESTDYGLKRGITKERRARERKRTNRTSAPTLPIGEISGTLQRSRFVRTDKRLKKRIIVAGFSRSGGGGLYAVRPEGTKRMVGRGLWGKGEKGALGKKVREYRKAFRDHFLREQYKP